jgi:YfiH family protein
VGDDPTAVADNRRRLAQRLGLPVAGWAWLHQVHGSTVVSGDEHRGDGPPPDADAAVTAARGVPLVVQTADCAPLALASDDAVAVVHAGWPGLVAGVVPAAVERLRAVGQGEVRAALGPCVHPCCYEFGRDDLDRVVAALDRSVESRTADGALALDIPTAVRVALARAGVHDLVDVDVCTFTSRDHFSHRRDGVTGRQALVAHLP